MPTDKELLAFAKFWITPKDFAECIKMRAEGKLSSTGFKLLLREIQKRNQERFRELITEHAKQH